MGAFVDRTCGPPDGNIITVGGECPCCPEVLSQLSSVGKEVSDICDTTSQPMARWDVGLRSHRVPDEPMSSASLTCGGALNVEVTELRAAELRTDVVVYPRIHVTLLNYAPVISTEKAHPERRPGAEIAMSVFEPAPMYRKPTATRCAGYAKCFNCWPAEVARPEAGEIGSVFEQLPRHGRSMAGFVRYCGGARPTDKEQGPADERPLRHTGLQPGGDLRQVGVAGDCVGGVEDGLGTARCSIARGSRRRRRTVS